MQRAHAEGFIHADCCLDRLWRGVFTAHYLYQRQQVDRVKGVSDYAAFRVGRALIELAGQQPGGARTNQGIRLGRGADLAVQLQLQLQAFGSAFLDEVGVFYAVFDGSDKAQAVLGGAGRQALLFKGAPGVGDAFTQGRLGTGGGVPGHYIQAMGKSTGYPAAADDTAAQRSKGFDFGDKAHGDIPEKFGNSLWEPGLLPQGCVVSVLAAWGQAHLDAAFGWGQDPCA